MKLLENPLIKWAGILAIIYFALFSNKNNPDSLSNRLSGSNIKKNLNEAKEKSEFIITNVKIAQSMAESSEDVKKDNFSDEIITENLSTSNSVNKVKCGDEVEILTSINSANGKNISTPQIKKIIIGSDNNPLLEEKIMGVAENSAIRLKIKESYQSHEREIAEILNSEKKEIYYDILIKEINPTKANNLNLSCR
jgi:hypothetical protein